MKKPLLTLLGSSAALLVAFSANAADAVVAEAPVPPASYVQVCDAFGTGYFYIPGTESCLKLSGAVSFSAGNDTFADENFAGAEAYLDIDTRSDSELGTIGTKIRLSSHNNFDAYYVGGSPERTTDVELAYITVGPAYFGYKETLLNTDLLYGDFDLESISGELNAATVGFLQTGIYGGVYAGLAVETNERGEFFDNDGRFADDYVPDVVGRVGLSDQSWGGVDLSGIYSDESEAWFLKATADLKASEAIDFRLAAGYGDADGDKAYLITAAGKYTFSDKFAAFTGIGYFDQDSAASDYIAANAGVTWTPVANLDVTGQLTYSDLVADDDYNTKVTITRKF
ncbi:hypothetical protein GOB57_24780 [Sinorhizobium meliloti]|nr:hypothetical protein [Sinorhizobium meliloti]